MAGMIYRKFYPVCNTATMLQLYVSYIRPLLEYAVPVWDPHTASNSRVMENVQKFSLRMCWKEWDASYDALISRSGFHTFADRSTGRKVEFPCMSCTRNHTFP